MKRLLLATLLGISTLATQAFEDKDSPNGANINSQFLEYNGVFDLVTSDGDGGPNVAGFAPNSAVNQATASFSLQANGNFVMTFDIYLDTLKLISGATLQNGLVNPNPLTEVITPGGGGNEAAILLALQDGISNYKVIRTDDNPGTLNVISLDLVVDAENVRPLDPNAVATPDAGSSFALAGIGFAAIASLRRKLSR